MDTVGINFDFFTRKNSDLHTDASERERDREREREGERDRETETETAIFYDLKETQKQHPLGQRWKLPSRLHQTGRPLRSRPVFFARSLEINFVAVWL